MSASIEPLANHGLGQAAVTRVRPDATPSVVAFVADNATREIMAGICESVGLPAAVHAGGVDAALHCIGEIPAGTTLVIDFDGCPLPEADAAVLATLAPAGVRLVGIASDATIRAALAEAGMNDFSTKPVTNQSVSALFGGMPQAAPPPPPPPLSAPAAAPQPRLSPPPIETRIMASTAPPKAAPQLGPPAAPVEQEHELPAPLASHSGGRIIAVLGVRGGVGASTLASSIALELSRGFSQRTALIDLDLSSGTQLLALNARAGGGLRDSLEKPQRMDDHMLDRLAIKVSETLHLFGGEEAPDQPVRCDARSAGDLIRFIANKYQRVVIDVPRTEPALLAATLLLADEVILVGDLTLAGARDLLRSFAWLRRVNPRQGLRLVSGGATPPKRELVAPAQFEKLSGRPLDAALQFDVDAAATASRGGRALTAISKSVAKSVRALVCALEGREPERRGLAFWRGRK